MRRAKRMRQEEQWLAVVEQARQKWVGKLVRCDLGQGRGFWYGIVEDISEEGDVQVVAAPGYGQRVPVVVMSLGYMDQTLTLVNG